MKSPVNRIVSSTSASQLMRRLYSGLMVLCLFAIATLNSHAGTAIDTTSGRITLNLKTEPPTLNSLISTDQVSTFVLSHVMEGLLHYNADNRLSGGVAERWEVRDDGATFWLRKNARWSDGKPVTAHDFVFAWRMAVAPQTASQYAFILFPIRNAEQINQGKLPVESLGVRAVDDYQLDIDFATACPYFAGLTAFPTYYPIRADVYRKAGERYAADKEDLLFNGAFTIAHWVHGAHLRLEKNPYYWQQDKIRLNIIDMPYMTSDNLATFNLFKAGAIVVSNLTAETLPDALQRGDSLQRFATGSIYYLAFNFRDARLTQKTELRQAIQSVIDTDTIVNKVIGLPGILPGHSLFPATTKGLAASFREEYPPPQQQLDLQKARQLIANVTANDSSRQLSLTLLVNDSPLAARQAEYLQYLLQQALGIQIRIDKQVFKQYLDKMKRGEFDLTLAGWGPDYDDPMTFADLMASWNENNRGRYRSARYDELVRAAQRETDRQKRLSLFAAMQTVLAEDVPIIPLYENAEIYVQHPQLKGVVRTIFGGDPIYRYAWLESR